MKKERFISQLSKKHSGELVGKDLDLLEHEIKVNEEYQLLSNQLESYLSKRKNLQPTTERLERIWEKIYTVENDEFDESFDYTSPIRKSATHKNLLKVAAILVLCFGAGFLGYRVLNHNTVHFQTAVAGDNKTFKLLDDGTKIWLNKKSAMRYNTEFGKHRREITLEGEAYFDVTKNKDVPLIIHVGSIDIEVKGTAFNVNAYKESAEIQVALIRGKIEVTDRLNVKNQVLLKPNEKLTFSNVQSAQNNFTVMSLASGVLLKDIKWTADTLTFRKEKLKDLAVRMEKKYDLKIEIHSEQLSEKRFSGTFTTETIQQALEALKLSYPLTYTISNRLVMIKD